MGRRSIGSKIALQPGRWRLQVSVGVDPVTGKRRRVSQVFYGTDRDADMELARMALTTGRHGTTALTVWQFIETMYLPSIEPPVLRRRTVDGYRMWLERFVKPTIGGVRLDRLDAYAAVSWMRGVKTQVSNKQTQLHVYSTLSAALGRAVKWGLIPENVLARAVDRPVPHEYVPVVLTEDDANAYLDAFAGHPLEPVVVLGIGCGLRPSEIHGLAWGDIDLASGTVTIQSGMHERKGETWYEEPKSRKSRRTIALPPWAVKALRPHRRLGRVCGDLKPSQVAYRYKRHTEASGLPWCPLENLRHTSATLAAEGGADRDALAARFGHTSPKMLDRRYVKRTVLRDQAVAGIIEEFRKPAKEARREAR